ncbi:PadR family transcriptional regulator [Abyssicoccus albus]|uniref:PadR family transcriptional regulator PadR n=1 Tax=Abyssicoccus albus TaxID=1817405 RepID=A0A3N5BNI7_9BACL|nr:PadR family transcriptional regulator [Abyssicoccus albus]RPF56640.1 PadR family transcriptional regulator PadR [Abyssicoccus albus]
MAKRTQLLKGIIDACILKIISREVIYGYELSQRLQQYGLDNISEGTIYPVLLRLQKNDLIYSEYRKSDLGPKRKYYFITSKGEEELEQMVHEWQQIHEPIQNILKGDGVNE